MKKLIVILLSVILLISCTTLKQINNIQPSKYLYGIDFSPFTAKNFLITPEKYLDSYESIGLINYESFPGATYEFVKSIPTQETKINGEKVYNDIYEWKTDRINIDSMINEVYNICVEMGADAIVNFEIKTITEPYLYIKNPITITGYKINGFAIKRKN